MNHRIPVADQADVLNSARFNGPEICHEIDADSNIDIRGRGGLRAGADDGAAAAGVKPKPVTTVPIRPALQTPADTANAMAQAERQAIQSDLAWVGQYNGAITGEVSERMVAAIKEFQKDRGGKQTGVLNPQERGVLAETAQAAAGQCRLEDRHRCRHRGAARHPDQAGAAAIRATPTAPNGVRPTGTIQIQLARRKEANPTTAKLAEQEKKEPAGRKVEYTVVKPDFFVLSGMQGLKKFYVRGTFKGDEVRILTILYDQATEGTVEPVVIAMSSAFNPFPSGAQIAGRRRARPSNTAPALSSARTAPSLPTARSPTAAWRSRSPAYGNADRVAEDKDHDLALLRIYGARGLKPLGLATAQRNPASNSPVSPIRKTRAAAPRRAASRHRSPQVGSGSELALSPAPALGFSGAAALDGDGKFAGIALLKPMVVAGPPNRAPAAQAVLVPADTVREFLKANGVNAAGGSSDAKASVVRVICVRK